MVLFITTIISFVILARYLSKKKSLEGFEDTDKEKNPLSSVMALIRRSGARLMDIDMWKERILMSSMSPVELARHYLKSQAKSGDAEKV